VQIESLIEQDDLNIAGLIKPVMVLVFQSIIMFNIRDCELTNKEKITGSWKNLYSARSMKAAIIICDTSAL